MKFWRKPLDHDKFKKPEGEVHIIPDRCKGCGFCIEFCPNDVLVESEDFNIKGYHPPEAKEPEKCISCQLCELICPDFAIFVVALDEEKTPSESKDKTKTKRNSKTSNKSKLSKKTDTIREVVGNA
jgi:2-oxoglutarate ferredoxin oxidoreductase subunit delta